jgi:pyruvate dehydrogenase E2 component (dihydrolipoamide acetyltransferase)
MASFEFRLPDIGEGVAEGEVVKWFVHEGDEVREDAPLVSVLTDKANVEIPSPKAGRIVRLHAAEGAKVKVGALLVTIETAGGASAPTPSPPASPAPATAPSAASPGPAAASGPSSGPRVLATPYVRRLANEKGVDLGGLTGTGPGGRITEEDVQRASTTGGPTQSASSVPAPASAPRSPASPDTPPRSTASTETPSPKSKSAAPSRPSSPADEVERVPIRGLRRVIAEHMAESKHRAAHFTYVEEVDATELVRTRDRMAKHVERSGLKLTYLPFIVKAVVAGLREYPTLNATMDDERQELIVHKRPHIGIALAGPDGLLVPVLRDADHKSVSMIARELNDLGERGRAAKLTRDELTGSTFTITSLGALGGVLATPILNYPEVGILGVHRIVRRPIYNAEGQLVPAHLMNLSISLDHRVIDGITGAQFLATVKAQLEDPHLLFADLA